MAATHFVLFSCLFSIITSMFVLDLKIKQCQEEGTLRLVWHQLSNYTKQQIWYCRPHTSLPLR